MSNDKKTNEKTSNENILSDEQLERIAGGSKPVYTYCLDCDASFDGAIYRCPKCGSQNIEIV